MLWTLLEKAQDGLAQGMVKYNEELFVRTVRVVFLNALVRAPGRGLLRLNTSAPGS